MRIFRSITVIFLLFAGVVSFAQDSLRLEKVVVVSRHGLRAPLEKYYQTLDSLAPKSVSWNLWSKQGVKGSELTLKGSALENLFGGYFRMWFNSLGFQLQDQEVYFGASSKQRTIATARSFAAGMFPLKIVPVHFKQDENGGYGPLDENYLPLFYDKSPNEGMEFNTVAFQKEAQRELVQLKKAPAYDFLEDVLQYSHSLRAKAKGSKHFDNYVDVQCLFYDKATGARLEPIMIGDLKVANRASDALILMYYEAPDFLKANFKRDFSFDDMCRLASIKDQYDAILFSAPIISVNISHCMLENVYSDMKCDWHRFIFLCSHDSMIHALLSALRVEDYKLENTIEGKTPIGVKFLLEKWVNPTTCEQYIKARLLYQSTEQIQKMSILSLENPPMSFNLSFKGLEKAENGMYRYEDFMNHIEKTLDAYNASARGQHPWE